jgi:hypothetical protein
MTCGVHPTVPANPVETELWLQNDGSHSFRRDGQVMNVIAVAGRGLGSRITLGKLVSTRTHGTRFHQFSPHSTLVQLLISTKLTYFW